VQFWGLHEPGQFIPRPRLNSLQEIYLLQNAQVMSDGFVIESKGAPELRQIDQLT
jgi:hypothetical protein